MPAWSLSEIEAEARQRLDPALYDYFAGGADDEVSLRANVAAYRRVTLLPRVLRGVGTPDLRLSLLGIECATPILIAPTAFHRLAHPEGELATARGAARAGTILVLSMASTTAVESVAECARSGNESRLWFQLNLQPDLEFSRAIVRRAEAAGCRALVVTVDAAVFGNRERDRRNAFLDLPEGLHCENLREQGAGTEPGRVRRIVFWPELSWEQIDWLRSETRLPVVLKGIVHPDDARLAVEHGVSAIIVSNHGGRQLDGVPATLDLLPAVASAVAGRVPVLVDGGIRRGTDIVKALALGATAVAVGRPILWGLAVAGAEGVAHVLETLKLELARALALCGCRSLGDVSRDLLGLSRSELDP
jgi:4-hydroxymandelate oxidase